MPRIRGIARQSAEASAAYSNSDTAVQNENMKHKS